MIQLTDVTKKFGRQTAVWGMDLFIPQGSIYGLLGHNGAGKSTTLGMILGQVFADHGSITINGSDVYKNRATALSSVGAIFESPCFYDYLSAEANLKILSDYSAPPTQERLAEVIELVGLKGRIRDRTGTYSHGMRQRLALAQALLPGPELLILDEPADGLDPEGIAEMRQLVRRLNQEWNITILFSSHQLSEVEQLATHVAVMREGRLVFDDRWPPQGLDSKWVQFECDSPEQTESASSKLRLTSLVTQILPNGKIELSHDTTTSDITAWLVQNDFPVQSIGALSFALEEFYLEMAERDGKPFQHQEEAAP